VVVGLKSLILSKRDIKLWNNARPTTSSKIFWTFTVAGSQSGNYGIAKIAYGDGSDLTTTAIGDAAGSGARTTSGGMYDTSTGAGQHVAMQGLDAPNTTSATTYKLQWLTPGGTFWLNRRDWDNVGTTADRCISSLTLMEVLA